MENENTQPHKNKVHKILVHSYSTYLFSFLLGVIFNLIFGFQVFANQLFIYIGAGLLVFGSILIIWAQYTSAHLNMEQITKQTFCHGPYRFTRTPTNFGLFFVMFGFGTIINSFFIILFTIIAFIVAKFIFLDIEEEILAEKYGTPYLEYKKSVKF